MLKTTLRSYNAFQFRVAAEDPANVAFAPCRATSMLFNPVAQRQALASAFQPSLELKVCRLAAEDQSTALQRLSAHRLAAEDIANVAFAPCRAASMLPDPVLHGKALASASQLFSGLQARSLASEDQLTALQRLSVPSGCRRPCKCRVCTLQSDKHAV